MSAVASKPRGIKNETINLLSYPKTGFGRLVLGSAALNAIPNIFAGILNLSLTQIAFGAIGLGLTHYAIHRLENPTRESFLETIARDVFCCRSCRRSEKDLESERVTSVESSGRSRTKEREPRATAPLRSSSVSGRGERRERYDERVDFEDILSQPVKRTQAKSTSRGDELVAAYRAKYESKETKPTKEPAAPKASSKGWFSFGKQA